MRNNYRPLQDAVPSLNRGPWKAKQWGGRGSREEYGKGDDRPYRSRFDGWTLPELISDRGRCHH